MKGITVTNKLGLKGGIKGTIPFIKLLNHTFNSVDKREDCKILICVSKDKADDLEAKEQSNVKELENIISQQAIISKEGGKIKNNSNLKKMNSDLLKLKKQILTLYTEVDVIKSSLGKDKTNKNLESKISNLNEIIEKHNTLTSDLKNETEVLAQKANDNVKRANKSITESRKTLDVPFENIWTNQYPSFKTSKALTDKEVYELLKKQYKGAKDVN